eukprot:5072923-Pyramimonas_sp.AAC.2
MLQGPPRLNSWSIPAPSNIIIAKWGDDRKSAFRLALPPSKNSGRFPGDREFPVAAGNWRFRVGLPRK